MEFRKKSIDSKTKISSIQQIFDAFRELKIDPKEIKVIVLGGWKNILEIEQMAEGLLKILKSAGFIHISTKNMLVKEDDETNKTDVSRSYFYGALVDAKSGKTFIMKEFEIAREFEQLKLYEKQSADKLEPLTRVT